MYLEEIKGKKGIGREGDRERRGGYGEKRGIGRKGVRTKSLQIIYFSCILLK